MKDNSTNNNNNNNNKKFVSGKDFSTENLRKEKAKRLEMQNGNNNDKSIYYKDVALIRYDDETVQVVNDTGFMNTFLKRANDDYWKKVSCVQTNIKSKLGCGTPIIVKFYAPVDQSEPENEIKYDFRSLGDDGDLVRQDQHQYCLKQCYKMCYYVSKVYNVEILKMRCEFLKDENGTVIIFVLMPNFLYRFGFSMLHKSMSDLSKVNNTYTQ